MHTKDLSPYRHSHTFGQEHPRAGEKRTIAVIVLTAVMMVFEIGAGWAFGSMALLADGLHMASHTVALFIVAAAYVYARRRAHDERFAFGTGKVNALAGFTGAILLAMFALMMAVESLGRFIRPVPIEFSWAIVVAAVGLLVNVISAVILMGGKGDADQSHHHGHGHGHGHGEQDHNLRSAYLHVLADAVTSLAAIVALLAGKYFGAVWMDPTMGAVGSLLVARWSWGLSRDSARVLLDHQAPLEVRREITSALEAGSDDRVADLHVWSIGPGLFAAEIAIVTHHPASPSDYKARLPKSAGLAHTTVEVHHCTD